MNTDGKAGDAQVPSNGELVRRVRAGDPAGFDELVRRYQRQATKMAYRMLTNLDDAMEITQDAFLRAFDRIATLSDPERFGPWLLRIVSNLALNRRRSRALRKAQPLDATGSDEGRAGRTHRDYRTATPLEQVTGDDLDQYLARAIDELPDMQRQALVLFSIEKMPQKQVAEILDCTVEAVKWHVFMARRKLKEKLNENS
jgi:RNA polymerase sigma-70 factor (ECF subfamily)